MSKHNTTTRKCLLCQLKYPLSGFKSNNCINHKIPSRNFRYVCVNCTETSYKKVKDNAVIRHISFDLSEPDFEAIRRNSCWYCDFGNVSGIDRYDNSDGYSKHNCVPCCRTCNRFKGSMHGDDFIKLCHQIAEKHPIH